MSIYDKLFGKNAEESEMLIDSAILLVRLGKHKEAEEKLKRAIKIAPSYGKPHRWLGYLYERVQRDHAAEKEYEKAIQLEPDHAEYHNKLATLYFRQNRFKESEKEFRRTIELDPKSEDGHANLGALLMKMKKYTEAEQVLRKAIKIMPANGHPHRYLSVVLYETNRVEEALQELETAIDIYAKDGQTNTAQLESVASEMRAKIKKWGNARLRSESKPAKRHTIEHWNENHSKALRVLNKIYDIYTDRLIPEKKKAQQLTDSVNKNYSLIYHTEEFSELLESEIEKTIIDGPAIIAIQYLDLRWLITGREDHRREMDEYMEKAKGMDFKELTDTDL